ncbi:MAG: hypothetical protein A3C38_02665 [Planctomycetes bacterium RIFCSPHIGHO2_02_FULL_50_42]|nr:MAG: hypothetical protein A2060_02870 [Planctomycetes bacterium GWA2_50_13]OHB87723.1 MAG: hypothetical protein A3C38_02665 [Planctomycetes bacterium RIFCSPHIGHO2_02_FULL_50_42]OHB92895.1 MAG: hypothetical protein A3E75_00560 [Planctomycetes bacterium RIFCSPHIGHO2_12_FULL_51_37]OHB95790.1 MAG: hypothetical protein A3I59_02745 [Planctomycetes bacterium RIFCSPLOWO2_02_FULL_50_16]HCN20012.1 hypothetical protein [Planctomycetia bacterium]
MVALDFGMEGALFVVAVLSLVFLTRSRKALTLKAVNRARFFLLLLVAMIIVENGLGIYFGFRRAPDTITMETLVLALVGTALVYSGRARNERPRENLSVAIVCIVWTVMAEALELILGLFLKG